MNSGNQQMKAMEKRWTKEAEKHLKGKRIVKVRYLSEEEKEQLHWYHRCEVIQFDDGSLLFPSRDDEGNDAGALFGQTSDGEDYTLPVL